MRLFYLVGVILSLPKEMDWVPPVEFVTEPASHDEFSNGVAVYLNDDVSVKVSAGSVLVFIRYDGKATRPSIFEAFEDLLWKMTLRLLT